MSRYLLRVMRGGCEVQYRDESGSFILSQLKQMWQRFAQLEEAGTEPIPDNVKPCGMPHSFWLQRGSFVAEVASDTDVKFIQSVMSLWCHAMIEGQWPGAAPLPATTSPAVTIDTPEALADAAPETIEPEPTPIAERDDIEEAVVKDSLDIELVAPAPEADEIEEDEPELVEARAEAAIAAAETSNDQVELPLKPAGNPLSALAGASK